jgi:hypothetical protein
MRRWLLMPIPRSQFFLTSSRFVMGAAASRRTYFAIKLNIRLAPDHRIVATVRHAGGFITASWRAQEKWSRRAPFIQITGV